MKAKNIIKAELVDLRVAFMSLRILDLIMGRRSVRKYSPREIPREVLFRILEAARWAPSAHNAQPWRFIIVVERTLKRRLAEAMAEKWIRDMVRDNIPSETRERLAKSSIERFTKAPVLIIACLTMRDMDRYPDERRQRCEYILAVQSLTAAIQNMLLVAFSLGLGTCWFCAPLFSQDSVREVLKIPEDIEPQALITLGYPSEWPKPPSRKPIREIAYKNYWGEEL